ncbi:MAG: response regulator [Bacteroidetes bacterium]|nr:response regulator [Bacteroidota bacterium]MBU1678304.1 response regulator [Bacteroidota bacterium]MBU2506572.1 response regulator [Bacteroidota bacterium]
MKILVANNNHDMRNLLHEIIDDTSTQIQFVKDGWIALKECEDWKPDWIMIDVCVDRIDGFTAAKAIKQMSPKQKVILLLEREDVSLNNSAQNIGIDVCMLKEDLTQLRKILKQ